MLTRTRALKAEVAATVGERGSSTGAMRTRSTAGEAEDALEAYHDSVDTETYYNSIEETVVQSQHLQRCTLPTYS